MKRIEAKVADEYESGTDCTVTLQLKNPGETEICETGTLDEPFTNNWARGGTEAYNMHICNGVIYWLKPRENLQFKFLLHSSCIDHMQLVYLRVYFRGGRYFQWSGKHWFTPTSDWMVFDFEGEIH